MFKKNRIATAMVLMGLAAPALAADATSERIRRLEAELEALKAAVEATAEAVEQASGMASDEEDTGHARIAGHEHGSAGRTVVGAYGEIHYANWEAANAGGRNKTEADFHRFIIFLGHEFNERIRFFSELEMEHAKLEDTAGGDSPGAVVLEQAYLEFDLNDRTAIRGGLVLMPVGFINEIHEPPTFYGVERPVVDKYILPTTWAEGGAQLFGQLGDSGLSYDLLVTTGLKAGTNVRSGRQTTAKADASDLAYTARLKWTGIPGLEIAGTVNYQTDMTQDRSDAIGSAIFTTGHVRFTRDRLSLTALYAQWDIDVGTAAPAADRARDKQFGYYGEASWKFTPGIGVYARYSVWDNGGTGANTEKTRTEGGVNWWPHEQIVLKADIFTEDNTGYSRGFNLGLGYMF